VDETMVMTAEPDASVQIGPSAFAPRRGVVDLEDPPVAAPHGAAAALTELDGAPLGAVVLPRLATDVEDLAGASDDDPVDGRVAREPASRFAGKGLAAGNLGEAGLAQQDVVVLLFEVVVAAVFAVAAIVVMSLVSS
jgi:hypothetical protein